MNTKVILSSPVKMVIPPILAVCLFIGTVFAVILPSFNASIMERKKETTIQLVDVVIGILSYFEDQTSRGIISQQEAKALAASEIRSLRYGKDNNEYFWINDLEPVIIMHPYRPELEGQKAANLVNANERKVFQDIAAIASKDRTGFLKYKWQWHDDRNNIVPKLSYVRVFPQWQWVVGTGLYLDDVKTEISALSAKLSGFAFLALLLITMISCYIARQSIVSDRRRKKAETLLQDHHNQLEQTIQQRTTQLTEVNEQLVKEAEERHRAENKIISQNSFLRDVIESLPFPFYVIDIKDYSMSLANQYAISEGGVESSCRYSSLRHSQNNKLSCCSAEGHKCPVTQVKAKKKPIVVEHTRYDRSGKKQYVEIHGYPVLDHNGDVIQVIKTVLDITVRKEYADSLAKISMTDELTGLFNRRGFFLLAQKQLEIARRKKCNMFLMYADLDNLKSINDTVGHAAGDDVIIEAGRVFQTVFRKTDIIGRIGGDEFTILFTCDDHSGQDSVQRINERLEQQISLRNSSGDTLFELSLSTGVAMFDVNKPVTLDELLKVADRVMYSAKMKKKLTTTDEVKK